MEPLFETKITVTWEEYKKMAELHAKKYFMTMVTVAIVEFVCALIMLLCRDYVLTALIGAVSLLVLFAGCYVRYIMPKKFYAKNRASDGKVQTVTFYKDSFKVVCEKDTFSAEYDKIDKIIETDTNFYIYISRESIVNILKENCVEDLIWFLRRKKYEH